MKSFVLCVAALFCSQVWGQESSYGEYYQYMNGYGEMIIDPAYYTSDYYSDPSAYSDPYSYSYSDPYASGSYDPYAELYGSAYMTPDPYSYDPYDYYYDPMYYYSDPVVTTEPAYDPYMDMYGYSYDPYYYSDPMYYNSEPTPATEPAYDPYMEMYGYSYMDPYAYSDPAPVEPQPVEPQEGAQQSLVFDGDIIGNDDVYEPIINPIPPTPVAVDTSGWFGCGGPNEPPTTDAYLPCPWANNMNRYQYWFWMWNGWLPQTPGNLMACGYGTANWLSANTITLQGMVGVKHVTIDGVVEDDVFSATQKTYQVNMWGNYHVTVWTEPADPLYGEVAELTINVPFW